MKKIKFSLFTLAFLLGISNKMTAQDRVFPFLKTGGGMFNVPEAVPLADLKTKYKIMVDISTPATATDSVHQALDKLARLVNLHLSAGIPKENLAVVAVFHTGATPIILSDEAYQKKFKVPNPNTLLINELAANGVQLFVCGQSLRARKLVDEKRNANIKVVQSALLALSTFQMKGFVLVPLGL